MRVVHFRYFGVAFGLAGAIAAVGCGSSSSSGSSQFSSGLPGTTVLGQMSDAQSQSLCSQLSSFEKSPAVATNGKELGCRFIGILAAGMLGSTSDAQAQSTCKAAYDPCIKGNATQTSTCTKPSATCTATVAELETCINDSVASLQTLLNEIPTCSTLTVADLSSDGGTVSTSTQPASCTALSQKCPGAPGTTGTGG